MTENPFAGSRILLVEDEETLATGLEYNLVEEGYHVTRAKDGREALELFSNNTFDLILLDIMLPYLDGFEVAAKVRESAPRLPILMLTARTLAKDRIQGLELGADDYMSKPFHLEELLLRISGMLRRRTWYDKSSEKKPIYRFGNNQINFDNLEGETPGGTVNLTMREAMLLKYMIENKGKVVSREELLEKVWQIQSKVETRTIDNFVVRLRKYFEKDPENPVHIKSIRGIGYLFEA